MSQNKETKQKPMPAHPKKEEHLGYDYKDCILDLEPEYVHIVQKGVFETDVYYQNIESLSYQYKTQTITVNQKNYEISVSTSNEKDLKPFGRALMIVGVLLLVAGLCVVFFTDGFMTYFENIINNFLGLSVMSYVSLGAMLIGLILMIVGTILLLKRKKRPDFKAGYDELNAKYHEKQDENVILRSKKLGKETNNQLAIIPNNVESNP